ncbi:MAG: TnsA-like heteromeric transposase endonuclease subunit [Actinomycetota bacterium]|nr:TnsA-like heteromeric transposase endonuclease subunit [Actinomycetota bacterium]
MDASGGFEVSFASEDGAEHRSGLAEAWAVPFESGVPVRRFTARKGQRHLSGLWWSATMGRHVGFESWLERDHVMLLDFDPSVVGIASQPFWLHWHEDESGKRVSHVPDFFARGRDGSAVVIDCRPVERRPPRDAARFDATARACALVGWEYRLVGATDVIQTANVRWLAGYRHPRHRVPAMVASLREMFASPTSLVAGAEAVGDPIAVLPVLFHLLWCHELIADLSMPLDEVTVLRTAVSR